MLEKFGVNDIFNRKEGNRRKEPENRRNKSSRVPQLNNRKYTIPQLPKHFPTKYLSLSPQFQFKSKSQSFQFSGKKKKKNKTNNKKENNNKL